MTAPELPIQDVSGEDRLRVTGAPHYQDELAAASGPKRSGGVEDRRPFALVAEPDNPHDPHAIAVHLEGGAKIGYLPARRRSATAGCSTPSPRAAGVPSPTA